LRCVNQQRNLCGTASGSTAIAAGSAARCGKGLPWRVAELASGSAAAAGTCQARLKSFLEEQMNVAARGDQCRDLQHVA
jgi:hypothetical protein